MEILHAQSGKGVGGVMVAAHAELGQLQPLKTLCPGGLEVSQQEDELGLDRRHQAGDRRVRRLVCEGQDAHGEDATRERTGAHARLR
jgi:hypothetical protein